MVDVVSLVNSYECQWSERVVEVQGSAQYLQSTVITI